MSLIGTMDSGVSALNTFQKGLEVIGNNIANVNTIGFKGSSAQYADSFSDILKGSSAASSSGLVSDTPAVEVGTGVKLTGISTDFSQGQVSTTGVNTDLAISGNGFFIVKDATTGVLYATRDGQFRIDSNGYMVNAEGDRLQGLTGGSASSAPTTVGDIKLGTPPTGAQLQSATVNISGGFVETYSDGSTATTNTVLLQNYDDPAALESIGDNLYSNLASAGPIGGATLSGANNTAGTLGLGTVQAGALEGSNVDLTQQFSDLITTQRSFEAASRLVTVSDTILDDIVNLKRS
jgi:flagellar hook protein FlgE